MYVSFCVSCYYDAIQVGNIDAYGVLNDVIMDEGNQWVFSAGITARRVTTGRLQHKLCRRIPILRLIVDTMLRVL